MLDVLSHGRLVAGMPVGGPPCASLCYGVPPLEQRERYYEAHDLIVKAWTADDVFAWNGKFFQLPFVNVWPRPMQTPHPPVWVPGVSSTSTWDFAALNDYAYMTLSAFSGSFGINGTLQLMNGFWNRVDALGKDHNPFRAGIAIFPMVGDSMAQIERDYGDHISYVFRHFEHIAPPFLNPPGYQDYGGLLRMAQQANMAGEWGGFDGWTFKDYVDNQVVVAGTALEVADQIDDIMRRGNAGHLMVMLQWGSMPKPLALQHIAAFGEGVLPRIQPLWEDEWDDISWPARLVEAPRPGCGRRGRVAGRGRAGRFPMTAVVDQEHSVWQDQVVTAVRVAGDGPPLVFFHGPYGLQWDPFLDSLARTTVCSRRCTPEPTGSTTTPSDRSPACRISSSATPSSSTRSGSSTPSLSGTRSAG